MQLSQLFNASRPLNSLIAWRDQERLELNQFKLLVLSLIKEINQQPSIQKWALCFNDSYYFAASLMAVLYCGKTPVIPGHLREAVLQEQLGEFEALLTDINLFLNCPIIQINHIINTQHTATGNTLPDWPKKPLSVILFTSGSTGKPKPIKKSITSLELESQILINQFGDKLKNGAILSTVSHQHLYGLTFRIILPLLSELPFDANMIEYHEQLQLNQEKLPILIASPAFLKRLDLNLKPMDYKWVFSAGGPLTYQQAQNVKQSLGTLPQEIYGTSETGIIATRTQIQENQAWTAFSSISITQHADKTIKVISPLFKENDGFRINDLIQLNENEFHLLERKDRIIKIEEKRISLVEIEQRLMALVEVKDAAIITLNQDERIVIGAVIVLSEQYIAESNQRLINEFRTTQLLRQRLRTWLEPIAIPKRWRIVTEIPQNNQGKRVNKELQELFL